MFQHSWTVHICGIKISTIIPLRNECFVCVFCIIALVGCREGQIFAPTEKLPAYCGVSSQIKALKGQDRNSALDGFPKVNEDRAVIIQQIIENGTDERLILYLTPRFQAQSIIVKTIDGNNVPLSATGQHIRGSRPPGVAGTGILPHGTERRSYILTRLFDLSEPGTYTVEIESRYGVEGKEAMGYFETNPDPIIFTVK